MPIIVYNISNSFIVHRMNISHFFEKINNKMQGPFDSTLRRWLPNVRSFLMDTYFKFFSRYRDQRVGQPFDNAHSMILPRGKMVSTSRANLRWNFRSNDLNRHRPIISKLQKFYTPFWTSSNSRGSFPSLLRWDIASDGHCLSDSINESTCTRMFRLCDHPYWQ